MYKFAWIEPYETKVLVTNSIKCISFFIKHDKKNVLVENGSTLIHFCGNPAYAVVDFPLNERSFEWKVKLFYCKLVTKN